MDDSTRVEAARLLLDAYATGRPIAPLTSTYESMSLEDAYAIQLLQVEDRLAGGRSVKGHKVGLTSAAMQRLLGVGEPDFGHLLDDFFHLEHEPIPMDGFLQPRIEPEVAFILKAPLRGPGVTVQEAIAAVDFVLPALEIVDSRVEDWKIGLFDTVADNASSGGVVLGSTPTPLHELDLRLVGAVMTRNGVVVGTGAGGAVLGSPMSSLVWLANTVGARGVTLEPGHVVLPGAVCAMVAISPGDTVTARFSGLGSVTARFAEN
ncbi:MULTISPECIES: 2-keto-4-pentenoate hydratase [unclassified Nocardioides]|uniref:2-keto-4-pentenoate hydratase n=1 Tax=unclassified Nocardioides TaxID=2615069 RepID=UPI0009F0DD6A|nr:MULTISPECIES: 2-keto-4-pentenoate hydratase [unclassified Nocardioides]GAW51863.1 2-keto-4-pentenoate hydratase [Nocardioides sp. PD653-B2]GAW53483.1 2-keto-4-pentenoate hydratase [Nocardioides sp. PD653]